MKKKIFLTVLMMMLVASLPLKAQKFNYTYNGVTITYAIISVRNHEVKVYSFPKKEQAVTVPAVVEFNGEAFKVTKIGYNSAAGHWDNESESWAFSGRVLLKTVVLPNTIEEIEEDAFRNCPFLRSINLPPSLKTMGEGVFFGCESLDLSTITLPSSLKKLSYVKWSSTGAYTFQGCKGTLYIPETVDTIGYDVFWGCNFRLSDKLGFIINDTIVFNTKNNYSQSDLYIWWGKKLISKRAFGDNYTVIGLDIFVKQVVSNPNYYLQASKNKPWASIVQKVISDQENKRRVAEEKARKEEEERQVREVIDNYIGVAHNQIVQGHLGKAIETLDNAIKMTQSHNYDYRSLEMAGMIDSIQAVQKVFSDDSKVFNYKDFCPDLYQSTQNALRLKIRTSLKESGKKVDYNNISFTLYSNKQQGSFQLKKSSIPLNIICTEILETTRLQPLIIDDKQLKVSATYNYDVEYASGTVNVRLGDDRIRVNPNFDLSPALESDLQRVFRSNLETLPSSCNGKYTFEVTSMNIDGQMEHDVKLNGIHCKNGPQNAWRSLFVPGWGDKYVYEKGEIEWLTTTLSYGLTGFGVYSLLSPAYRRTASYASLIVGGLGTLVMSSISGNAVGRIVVGLPFYALAGVGLYSTYTIYTNTFDRSSTVVPWTMISTGAVIWAVNVLLVWSEGEKNLRDCKNKMGQLFITYDATNNAPELVYSLSF